MKFELDHPQNWNVLGLMSGTSMDGVDVAWVSWNRQSGYRFERFYCHPFSDEQRNLLNRVSTMLPGDLSALNRAWAEWAIEAIEAAQIQWNHTDWGLIGSHGHTVFHEPGKHTLQIGEAAFLAEQFHCPVVSDFRPRDIAAGGQGAPLVPFVDHLLFSSERENRILLNIGGIANLTWLPIQGTPQAYDTGPGNMLLDLIANQATAGKSRFDENGQLAGSGKSIPEILQQCLSDDYFTLKPPKSTGRERFGEEFFRHHFGRFINRESWSDLAATALEFTVESIAREVKLLTEGSQGKTRLYVSGGGAQNPVLLNRLAKVLPGCQVEKFDVLGIPGDAKEAVCFAVVAVETMQGNPSSATFATGARHPAPLGKITLP